MWISVSFHFFLVYILCVLCVTDILGAPPYWIQSRVGGRRDCGRGHIGSVLRDRLSRKVVSRGIVVFRFEAKGEIFFFCCFVNFSAFNFLFLFFWRANNLSEFRLVYLSFCRVFNLVFVCSSPALFAFAGAVVYVCLFCFFCKWVFFSFFFLVVDRLISHVCFGSFSFGCFCWRRDLHVGYGFRN